MRKFLSFHILKSRFTKYGEPTNKSKVPFLKDTKKTTRLATNRGSGCTKQTPFSFSLHSSVSFLQPSFYFCLFSFSNPQTVASSFFFLKQSTPFSSFFLKLNGSQPLCHFIVAFYRQSPSGIHVSRMPICMVWLEPILTFS